LIVFLGTVEAQQIYRGEAHVGQNWGTVRVFRPAQLQINGPIINTYRYRVVGITSWASISGKTPMVPWTVLTLNKSINVPAGFNAGMSGTMVSAPSVTYLMEFDFNNNGTADGSIPFNMPQCDITFYYPGGTGSYPADRTIDAVTITLNTGGEPTASVHDPLPVLGDNDGDGIADAYDPDDDNDGIPDELDMFPLDPTENADQDGDGTGDNTDPDRDGDGVPNDQDKFPNNPNESADHDNDGIGDNIDWDDDNDGVWDSKDPDPRGPVGPKPNPGDGNGGIGNPINPGNPIIGGGGGGDGELELGDMGSPGALTKPTQEAFNSLLQTAPAQPADGIGDFAIDGLADDLKAAGAGMKGLLAGWQPFQTYVPSGDMTSFVADLGRFGNVTIPFPADNASIGIFRGCCLFALYWGAVVSVMRILKV